MIYLANEVVQQSKARKRDDFLIAFSPLMPEAVAIGFRGAHADIRNKIKRVVEVWRQRAIFDEAFQSAAEARIKELETSQSAGGKKLLGGSLFSNNTGPGLAAPAELKPLVPLQENVTKIGLEMGSVLAQAEKDVTDVTESPASQAPLRIARYHKALKSLSQAETAVADSIKARSALIEELEKLVRINRDAIAGEEERREVLQGRSATISDLKRQEEDNVMRGPVPGAEASLLANSNVNGLDKSESEETGRLPTEELTPPPVEEITPIASPATNTVDAYGFGLLNDAASKDIAWELPESSGGTGWNTPEPGADLLASLSRPFSSTDMAGEEVSSKKQRTRESSTHIVSSVVAQSIPGLDNDVDDLISSARDSVDDVANQ